MYDDVNPPHGAAHDGERIAQIPVAEVRLQWTEPWDGPPAPHLLRGAVAAAFPDCDLFHQHRADGRPIYRYPRIHYRWDDGDGLLVGFGPGVEALNTLFSAEDDLEFRLGTRIVRIREAVARFRLCNVRRLDGLRRYRFRTPWLPLNQTNYQRFRSLDVPGKSRELDRLAVAGILSAFKGLGITLPFRVTAAFVARRSRWCRYKSESLLGFTGVLVCNLDLPADFAVGRAVSHGYGWLVDHTPRLVEPPPPRETAAPPSNSRPETPTEQ